MNLISKRVEKYGYKTFGEKIYLYMFSWLGTSIHELGHAVFALLFRHSIKDIKLFSRNNITNTLGHVHHTYNPKSIYQSMGNFFIGIGPILFGSLMIYLITRYLFGVKLLDYSNLSLSPHTFFSFAPFTQLILEIFSSVVIFIIHIILGGELKFWEALLLIYLLFSISSSITLSKADLQNTGNGILAIVILLFIFNMGLLWIGSFNNYIINTVSTSFAYVHSMIVLCIIINLCILLIIRFINLLTTIF